MLYLVDGVQGMTDDKLCCALGQSQDAIQTFDRRSRAGGIGRGLNPVFLVIGLVNQEVAHILTHPGIHALSNLSGKILGLAPRILAPTQVGY
jgi:hypothetical protein